jgi:GT2 family glycosyltransferase
VVVCTHRRLEDLSRLLASLGRLDPAPAEVIVVDNDPGERDCHAAVSAAGLRYVREDRRGLNNARNAGIAAAGGDIVVFIDDDCVAPTAWLARLPVEFENPAVGAMTGPAFPHVLDTPARRRMERQASLARGLRRLELDWTVFPVAGAGAIGVGANMAFRREVLLALGAEPFPPELDAGTITESGGDTYVIAKLLAGGHRVVYDPAAFVYHRHRADARALHRAFFGYGVGLGAALTRLLVEDRELSTPLTWMWLVSQYRRTQQRRLAGRADRVETRLAWDFLRGGMYGALRWRRAKRGLGEPLPRGRPTTSPSPPDAEQVLDLGAESDPPAVSVVVPTHRRPEALRRCLGALAAQDIGLDRFEVIVVDDSTAEDLSIDRTHTWGLRLRVIHTGGRGAATARNEGAAAASASLLLFLDDDVVAQPDLLRRHLERHHREHAEDLVVVGAYPPRPVSRSLMSMAAALWWNDLFRAMRQAAIPTYAGALTGNMSIPSDAFERSGGFDPRFGRYRREDWEWGLRVLKLGLALCYEPAACGLHEYVLEVPGRLAAARLEGYGDVLLLREHPDAGSAVIPLMTDPPSEGAAHACKRAAWGSPLVRAILDAVLRALEWGRLRLLWVRVFNAAQRLSYEHGVREADSLRRAPVAEPLVDLDLDATTAISTPAVAAPTLRVRVGGLEVARVRPMLGQWTPGLADQILTEVPWWAVEQAAASTGCFPPREEAHGHIPRTHVVFGPAHTRADSAHREQFADAGAGVSIVGGAIPEHWERVVAAARGAEPAALVALTMPGVHADLRWLEEALVAFDGARVGVLLGRALADDAPVAPLTLHARNAGGEEPQHDAALAPQYVVLRRELLPALVPGLARYGMLAPAIALAEDALEGGWVVGYRDVHGLSGAGARSFEGGRARAALRVRRSRAPVAAVCAELRLSTILAAWHFVRRRERRMAAEAYAGVLAGLCSVLWSLLPRALRWRR